MTWTKYNNPNRRKNRRTISRTEADIIASKIMFNDTKNGVEKPLSFYDSISDTICKKESRNIY